MKATCLGKANRVRSAPLVATAMERWYWSGVVLGIALGMGSFLLGCPWSTCFAPSFSGGMAPTAQEREVGRGF